MSCISGQPNSSNWYGKFLYRRLQWMNSEQWSTLVGAGGRGSLPSESHVPSLTRFGMAGHGKEKSWGLLLPFIIILKLFSDSASPVPLLHQAIPHTAHPPGMPLIGKKWRKQKNHHFVNANQKLIRETLDQWNKIVGENYGGKLWAQIMWVNRKFLKFYLTVSRCS